MIKNIFFVTFCLKNLRNFQPLKSGILSVIVLLSSLLPVSAQITNQISTRSLYDANHNMTNRIANDGTSTLYTYDDINRPTQIDHPGTAYDVIFSYNNNHSVTQMVDQNGLTEFIHDPDFDRLLEARHPDGSIVNYSYDQLGQLLQVSANNLLGVSMTYDNENRVVSTTDELSLSSMNYNPFTGQLQERVLSNSIRISYVYDPETGELIGMTQRRPDWSIIADIIYEYYPNGLLEMETDGTRTIYYEYDDLLRLKRTTYQPSDRVEEYEYDAAGCANRSASRER
ncbi:MAG: hypothetical protein GKR87_10745 [Kiritimatiellae bacterium]|nr:hypothetical protein [Kiritimatiellia bacterium]